MFCFSAESLEALSKAGWSPDRKVDLTPWVEPMRSKGFHPHDTGLAALASIGGLKLEPVVSSSRRCAPSWLDLDPKRSMYAFDFIEPWQHKLNVQFVPLGVADGGHGELFIDENETVYLLALRDSLILKGKSLDGAIRNMVCGLGESVLLGDSGDVDWGDEE